jgi:hypothetical protein
MTDRLNQIEERLNTSIAYYHEGDSQSAIAQGDMLWMLDQLKMLEKTGDMIDKILDDLRSFRCENT